jgi:hypothetical protein
MDFAVANGQVLQLTQTWSFQSPDQDALAEQVEAWGWSILELKEVGGELILGDESKPVHPDVDIAVIYIAPLSGDEAPAFTAAEHVFSSVEVEYVTPDRAEPLAKRALDSLTRVTDLGGSLHLGDSPPD